MRERLGALEARVAAEADLALRQDKQKRVADWAERVLARLPGDADLCWWTDLRTGLLRRDSLLARADGLIEAGGREEARLLLDGLEAETERHLADYGHLLRPSRDAIRTRRDRLAS